MPTPRGNEDREVPAQDHGHQLREEHDEGVHEEHVLVHDESDDGPLVSMNSRNAEMAAPKNNWRK
jgi:hypothetical protein